MSTVEADHMQRVISKLFDLFDMCGVDPALAPLRESLKREINVLAAVSGADPSQVRRDIALHIATYERPKRPLTITDGSEPEEILHEDKARVGRRIKRSKRKKYSNTDNLIRKKAMMAERVKAEQAIVAGAAGIKSVIDFYSEDDDED